MTNVFLWSTTPANNATADGSLWAEGMLPAAINDSARDNMAAQAMLRKDTSGEIVSGGSANAQTLTLNTASYNTLGDGHRFTFRAGFTNTGAATLNVNGTGAIAITDPIGNALVSGEIVAGGIYDVTYVSATPAWRLHRVDVSGAWIAYTPTVTAQTGTFTTVSATGAYKKIGKTVYVRQSITCTTVGTAATSVQTTLPAALSSISVGVFFNANTTKCGAAAAGLNTSTSLNLFLYDGTFPITSGQTIYVSVVYESS